MGVTTRGQLEAAGLTRSDLVGSCSDTDSESNATESSRAARRSDRRRRGRMSKEENDYAPDTVGAYGRTRRRPFRGSEDVDAFSRNHAEWSSYLHKIEADGHSFYAPMVLETLLNLTVEHSPARVIADGLVATGEFMQLASTVEATYRCVTTEDEPIEDALSALGPEAEGDSGATSETTKAASRAKRRRATAAAVAAVRFVLNGLRQEYVIERQQTRVFDMTAIRKSVTPDTSVADVGAQIEALNRNLSIGLTAEELVRALGGVFERTWPAVKTSIDALVTTDAAFIGKINKYQRALDSGDATVLPDTALKAKSESTSGLAALRLLGASDTPGNKVLDVRQAAYAGLVRDTVEVAKDFELLARRKAAALGHVAKSKAGSKLLADSSAAELRRALAKLDAKGGDGKAAVKVADLPRTLTNEQLSGPCLVHPGKGHTMAECKAARHARPELFSSNALLAASGAGPRPRREGDWDCPACGALNFSFRETCYKRSCGAAKPSAKAAAAAAVPAPEATAAVAAAAVPAAAVDADERQSFVSAGFVGVALRGCAHRHAKAPGPCRRVWWPRAVSGPCLHDDDDESIASMPSLCSDSSDEEWDDDDSSSIASEPSSPPPYHDGEGRPGADGGGAPATAPPAGVHIVVGELEHGATHGHVVAAVSFQPGASAAKAAEAIPQCPPRLAVHSVLAERVGAGDKLRLTATVDLGAADDAGGAPRLDDAPTCAALRVAASRGSAARDYTVAHIAGGHVGIRNGARTAYAKAAVADSGAGVLVITRSLASRLGMPASTGTMRITGVTTHGAGGGQAPGAPFYGDEAGLVITIGKGAGVRTLPTALAVVDDNDTFDLLLPQPISTQIDGFVDPRGPAYRYTADGGARASVPVSLWVPKGTGVATTGPGNGRPSQQ